MVEFLKAPQKYNQLGAKIPKGCCSTGLPAPGRPCWPKQWPGKRGCLSSASPGPTCGNVRGRGGFPCPGLFDQAKKNAPCIVFIDEIDAVAGREAPVWGAATMNGNRH